LNRHKKRVLESVEKATQDMAKDIRTWGDKRAELKTRLDDLEFTQYFTSIPLTKEAVENLVENVSPLVIMEYLFIAKVYCSENLNIKKEPPQWIMKKYYSISQYIEVELVDLLKWTMEYFI
jgi:hypothetical protein